jgi:hypothetical protein
MKNETLWIIVKTAAIIEAIFFAASLITMFLMKAIGEDPNVVKDVDATCVTIMGTIAIFIFAILYTILTNRIKEKMFGK